LFGPGGGEIICFAGNVADCASNSVQADIETPLISDVFLLKALIQTGLHRRVVIMLLA
jgi:hypothetical protein